MKSALAIAALHTLVMCGAPCTECKGHVYAHAPGNHKGFCLDCYVKKHPDQVRVAGLVKDKDGRWMYDTAKSRPDD